jgi:hypothetical protein
MSDKRADIRVNCEQNGLSWARATVGTWSDGEVDIFVREWIDEIERKDAAEREAEQRRLAKESLDAAKLAAEASEKAALATKESARWTLWAAITATASALISLWQVLRPASGT